MSNLYNDGLQLAVTHRVQQYIHEAEVDHLQSEMHSREASRWPRQARQALPSLGDGLSSLGDWLKGLNRRGARSMRGQSAG